MMVEIAYFSPDLSPHKYKDLAKNAQETYQMICSAKKPERVDEVLKVTIEVMSYDPNRFEACLRYLLDREKRYVPDVTGGDFEGKQAAFRMIDAVKARRWQTIPTEVPIPR